MIKKEVQTGGKLYLAGEYAVLTPGQGALIAFIPLYMRANIQPAKAYHLQSDLFETVADLTPQEDYALIQESVRLMEDFLRLKGRILSPFQLEISGKFERDGKKFGIGSSGSVVLLTLKAMAALYEVELSSKQLFRLASLVLISRGDNGSMGDLACIAYEDLIYYQSFDRKKIAKLASVLPLDQLLEQDWGYVIETIKPRASYDFLVGWTQEPAISKDLVCQVQSYISAPFLLASQKAVERLKEGFQTGQTSLVLSGIKEASQALSDLSPVIYTKKLDQLKRATKGLFAVAKSSGAGGGDCGIAFSFDEKSSDTLTNRWKELGIVLLYQERRKNR